MHLISSFPDETRSKKFMDFCAPLFPYGVTYMSHSVVDSRGNAEFFCTDAEWAARYLEGKYLEKDAIMRHALTTKTLFIPWNCLLHTFAQKKIYEERIW